jgi:predicted nucleotidyltransferase
LDDGANYNDGNGLPTLVSRRSFLQFAQIQGLLVLQFQSILRSGIGKSVLYDRVVSVPSHGVFSWSCPNFSSGWVCYPKAIIMTSAVLRPIRDLLLDSLESHEDVQAAALYGSVARGDAEFHSDLDLLLICNGGQKRELYDSVYPVLSKNFTNLSLSIYSPREINFLLKAKSLFLLHLQRESILLFDRTELFTNTLRDFKPKSSYQEDFRRSLDLFEPLTPLVMKSPNNFHRLAYLYSLFRVYGVYLLAEYRIFEFSKAKMASCLATICPEHTQHIELLSRLRVLNANFFSGGDLNVEFTKNPGNLPMLEACASALGTLVHQSFDLTLMPYSLAIEKFLSATQSHQGGLGYRMRSWFLLLVYDGLNLFCRCNGLPELRSFNAETLSNFTAEGMPKPIVRAALLGLEYLRNYPLKYFLLDESKISLSDACSALVALSALLESSN